jgi:hypothetical protein
MMCSTDRSMAQPFSSRTQTPARFNFKGARSGCLPANPSSNVRRSLISRTIGDRLRCLAHIRSLWHLRLPRLPVRHGGTAAGAHPGQALRVAAPPVLPPLRPLLLPGLEQRTLARASGMDWPAVDLPQSPFPLSIPSWWCGSKTWSSSRRRLGTWSSPTPYWCARTSKRYAAG